MDLGQTTDDSTTATAQPSDKKSWEEGGNGKQDKEESEAGHSGSMPNTMYDDDGKDSTSVAQPAFSENEADNVVISKPTTEVTLAANRENVLDALECIDDTFNVHEASHTEEDGLVAPTAAIVDSFLSDESEHDGDELEEAELADDATQQQEQAEDTPAANVAVAPARRIVAKALEPTIKEEIVMSQDHEEQIAATWAKDPILKMLEERIFVKCDHFS